MDGTLLDTLEDLYLATNHALSTFHMPERTLDEVRMFVGNGVRNLMIRAIPNGEQNPDFEACFSEFKTYYMQHCQDHTGLYPGIKETLQALKAQGIRMAVVSNKLQAGVTELFNTYFRDTMEVAIGEREGIRRKPYPDMVNLALQEMGLGSKRQCLVTKEDAVYIGDSDVDLATARNSGLPCISVLWGFRDKDFLLAHGATTFINKPQDLLTLK